MGKSNSKSHVARKNKDDYSVNNNNISTSPSSLAADSNNFVQSVHTNNPANARELSELEDKLEYEALSQLIGHGFTSAFRAIKHNPTKQSSSDRKYVSDLLYSLKREDVAFSPVEMNTLRNILDVKNEGVKAFVKAVDNDKIAIFTFDYISMDKTKYLLNVKCGRITTMKYIDYGDNREEVTPYLSKTPSLANQNYITKRGINISVYKADITQLKVDAIVNAANERLLHIGGVALAIARVAGHGLQIEGDEYIKTHGPLRVKDVVPTSSGNLPCKKVLHAVGPCWADYQDKNLCQQHLAQTVFNCFLLAHKHHVTSLAMSSISSATFGVPPIICTTMYLAAIQEFDSEYGHLTTLRDIHFVDISDKMVAIIQDTFTEKWNTTVTFTKQLTRSDFPHTTGIRQFEGAPHTGNTKYGCNVSVPAPRISPGGYRKFSSEGYYLPREVDHSHEPNKSKNSQTRYLHDRNRHISSDVGYVHDRNRHISSDVGYIHDRNRHESSGVGYIHDRNRHISSDVGYIHDRNRHESSDVGYIHDRNRHISNGVGYIHDRNRHESSDVGYIHDRNRHTSSDAGYKREQYNSTSSLDKR